MIPISAELGSTTAGPDVGERAAGDALGAARGIVAGVALSIPLWAGLALAVRAALS